MSTVLPVAPADLSARARILDAAMATIGDRGVPAATVRDVAAAAGVSPSLVTHHFGGKDALVAACNDRVAAFIADKVAARLAPRDVLAAATTTFGPYLAATLDGPTEEAARLFGHLTDLAREALARGQADGEMRESVDPEAQAVALVVLGLGPFTLRRRLTEWAGDGAIARLATPLAEIYTRGLLRSTDVLESVDEARGGGAS